MERKEKGSEESERKKQEWIVKKMKHREGGRRICSTPPPIWRLELYSEPQTNNPNNSEFLNLKPTSRSISARNLCACLWEIESHQNNPIAQMSTRPRARLAHKHIGAAELESPIRDPFDQSASASSLRKLVSTSRMQHHQAVESSSHALQPLSPSSCGSSMEVTPYKERKGESNCGLKTSTELLKVLNRIWSLEEQHASNTSIVKALKMELHHSQAIIKGLLLEKQWDRQEMDDLMTHVSEQTQIKDAVQSLRDELEGERKLRKHSESLHRKLARELSEVKSAFSNALIELEREKKACILLENLCDEFSKGIREYEKEVRSLKHNHEKDHGGLASSERLILHISEAWLDERMQMKLAEGQNDLGQKNTIVEKLDYDIETFLQAKRSDDSNINKEFSQKQLRENCSRRYSLESFPLNEAVSAPGNVAEGSTDSGSHYFQAVRSVSGRRITRSSSQRKNNDIKEQYGRLEHSSFMEKEGEEHMKTNILSGLEGQYKHLTRSMSNRILPTDEEDGDLGEKNVSTVDNLEQSLYYDAIRKGLDDTHSKRTEAYALDLSKSDHADSNCRVKTCMQSVFTGTASPVQKWKSNLAAPDFGKSESSLDWPPDLDQNTLMAKLLEARLEAKNSRTRSSKVPL